MMIRKIFKYRLYPNKTQEQKMLWTLDRCRELYNAALQERKDAWEVVKQSPNYYDAEWRRQATKDYAISRYDQQNQLPEMKEIREEYNDIGAHVLLVVCHRVYLYFRSFFRRVKNGETPGYPRFQGRNRYDSLTYPDGLGHGMRVNERYITFPKIGSIKVKLHRLLEGKIKTCTIKREGEQWYVTFCCEVPESEKLPISYEDVGIDLGITHLATLSNGEMIEHPRYYRKAEKILQQRQQALDRKKRGSHRRDKVRKLVAKASRKVARQRKDFLNKASRQLVNRYQVIVFEDITIGRLVRKPKPKQDETGKYLPNGASAKSGLNKSILDAGWGMFMEMCSSKAEEAGRTLMKVSPKYTSQICSNCGTVRKKDLSERWHSCECGAELDRDVNAAINILERGRRQQSSMAVEALKL